MSFGIAAAALLFGGTFLLIAIATGIAELLDWPVWAGFLIVAVLLSVIGFIVAVVRAEAAPDLSRGSARDRRDTEGEFRMDREAAVLRAEMSRTRAELDHKLARRSRRSVRDLTPRRLTERYMPDYFVDRSHRGRADAGGLKMAWGSYRELKRAATRLASWTASVMECLN